jgi:hypothetical protein
MKSWSCGITAIMILLSAGCAGPTQTLRVENIQSPVPATSILPQVTSTANGRLILSWLEPLAKGYSFRMAVRQAESWSEPRTIASSPDIIMFSADLPGVAEIEGGHLVAYWELTDLSKGDRFATSIQIAVSNDEGRTWSSPNSPYGDAHSGQHSFISAFPVGKELGLVWLDAEHRGFIPSAHGDGSRPGAIGLRYVSLDTEGKLGMDSFIDPIACECCPTSAAVTKRGPVVAYRDRGESSELAPEDVKGGTPTVRDIRITRLENGKWTEPRLVHPDNWVINLCPDNGPAVDATGNNVAVAWWTAANDQPKVQIAFSPDAGETFSPPIRIDNHAAEGQVTIAWLDGQRRAVVGWLEDHQTWARWVAVDGTLGTPVALGPAPRHTRLPRWIGGTREVFAVWSTQQDDKRSVRISRLRI